MGEFVHLTDKKWDIFEDWKDYDDLNLLKDMFINKPNGLYISGKIGTGSWMDWCLAENFYTSSANCFAVDIVLDRTKLLEISTPLDVKNCVEKYGHNPLNGIYKWASFEPRSIDWNNVAKDYDGIIVKYDDIYDFSQAWTTTLDCNCACIWNKKCISKWKYLDL